MRNSRITPMLVVVSLWLSGGLVVEAAAPIAISAVPVVVKHKYSILTKREADYILACQYLNAGNPGYGAINNIYGAPTWVVPRENALAILGLIEASVQLGTPLYHSRAQLAADYLVSVQDPTDGAWADQYSYATPVVLSKSPTQTTEVMIALYHLGYQPSRYNAMKRGAQYLLACQDPLNKLGNNDGLLGGGKDPAGQWYHDRWTSDNSFAYQAFRAAEAWALAQGDTAFAAQCDTAAQQIIGGIDLNLHIHNSGAADDKLWWRTMNQFSGIVNPSFHDWITYAPQMLDVPAAGVGDPVVGTWIHTTLQKSDGSVVWDDASFNQRKSPGFSFQASLAWLDLGQNAFAAAAKSWAQHSGLWQVTPDPNGIVGGWIDWVEPTSQANWWERFIDTSFYAIAVFSGGYDFRIATTFGVSTPNTPAIVDLDGDGRKDLVVTHRSYNQTSAMTATGMPLPGWSNPTCGTMASGPSYAPPAVADIDQDGFPEVVIGLGGTVCVLEHTGQPKWTTMLPGAGFTTVTISNLDGVGKPEIIVGGGPVFVLDANGTILPGWPQYSTNANGFVAVADLDGDGSQDLVFASGSQIYAVNRFGVPLPGWPVSTSGTAESPAIGDIDGDGFLDVVTSSLFGWVYVWNRLGQPLPGWPLLVVPTTPLGNGPVILTNVDSDPQPEIALGTASNGIPPNNSNLFIYDGNGSPIAQVGLGAFDPGDSPIAGNLDTTDATEEVFATNNGGTSVIWPPRTGWPKVVLPGATTGAALGDANGDGLLELVVPSVGSLSVFLTDAPSSAAPQHWATQRGDNARTGVYRP